MPRYLSQRKLPPYSYVPGKFPHPISDPLGHSFGVEHEPSIPLNTELWHECESYLWGIDLFNCGFYWEAHEAWEAAWIDVGRKGEIADFLKALIKLAAAGVKVREQNAAGVRRHAGRCLELLNQQAGSEHFLGLSVPKLCDVATQTLDAADLLTGPSNEPDERTLPFALELSERPEMRKPQR